MPEERPARPGTGAAEEEAGNEGPATKSFQPGPPRHPSFPDGKRETNGPAKRMDALACLACGIPSFRCRDRLPGGETAIAAAVSSHGRQPGRRAYKSESCTPLPEGGMNWSSARVRRVRVSSSRLDAISKRRAICQA